MNILTIILILSSVYVTSSLIRAIVEIIRYIIRRCYTNQWLKEKKREIEDTISISLFSPTQKNNSFLSFKRKKFFPTKKLWEILRSK